MKIELNQDVAQDFRLEFRLAVIKDYTDVIGNLGSLSFIDDLDLLVNHTKHEVADSALAIREILHNNNTDDELIGDLIVNFCYDLYVKLVKKHADVLLNDTSSNILDVAVITKEVEQALSKYDNPLPQDLIYALQDFHVTYRTKFVDSIVYSTEQGLRQLHEHLYNATRTTLVHLNIESKQPLTAYHMECIQNAVTYLLDENDAEVVSVDCPLYEEI